MKKILVIEDDLSIQQTIVDILEGEGYKSFTANNGKTGIELALEIKPDLIICDVMMPVVNGYEVISTLLKDPTTSTIPFIFLSAKVEKNNIRQGMELGADDYLTKPFRIDELINAVEARFRKKEIYENIPSLKNENQPDENKVDEEGHIILKHNGEPKLIKINSILCITAFADYTHVFINDGTKIIVRRLLKEWEKILPEKIFLRIHRSTIINLNSVEKIENWFNNSFSIHIKNLNEKFIISRRQSSRLKDLLHFK